MVKRGEKAKTTKLNQTNITTRPQNSKNPNRRNSANKPKNIKKKTDRLVFLTTTPQKEFLKEGNVVCRLILLVRKFHQVWISWFGKSTCLRRGSESGRLLLLEGQDGGRVSQKEERPRKKSPPSPFFLLQNVDLWHLLKSW